MIDLVIGASIVAVVIWCSVAVRVYPLLRDGLKAPTSDQAHERPAVDVVVTRCQATAGGLSAGGDLTNRSNRARSFTLSVQFLDQHGHEFTDTDVRTLALGPGQTGSWNASGATPLDGGPVHRAEPISCRVASVHGNGT
jgi:hypothetical protein